MKPAWVNIVTGNRSVMNTFVQAVLDRLPPIAPNEMQSVISIISDLQSHQWSKEDTAAYLKCTEHVNPDLDETTALARMRSIRSRVSY